MVVIAPLSLFSIEGNSLNMEIDWEEKNKTARASGIIAIRKVNRMDNDLRLNLLSKKVATGFNIKLKKTLNTSGAITILASIKM